MSSPRIVGSPEELTTQGVVEVVVPNLAAALKFYREVGFTVERQTPTFITLRYENTLLFVAQNPDAPVTNRWTNVRIIVADVDAVWQHIQRHRLPVGTPINDRRYGLRDFTVRDPAGFEVRFAQPLNPQRVSPN